MAFALRSIARSSRAFSTSARLQAVTTFQMPAMSPTMTEGGISSWKVKEGQLFAAGDVLLEIETDKATMDVEAQEDGVMAKIVISDGAKGVPVGKVIAMLAEEGDDLSSIEVPAEESFSSSSSSPQPSSSAPAPAPSSSAPTTAPQQPQPALHHGGAPKHARPLFPSVARLLIENGISDASDIKGSGVRGMLTRGDVLAHLGKIASPRGSVTESKRELPAPAGKEAAAPKEEKKPLNAIDIRRQIVQGLAKASAHPAAAQAVPTPTPTFDDILAPYLPFAQPIVPPADALANAATSKGSKPTAGFLSGLI